MGEDQRWLHTGERQAYLIKTWLGVDLYQHSAGTLARTPERLLLTSGGSAERLAGLVPRGYRFVGYAPMQAVATTRPSTYEAAI